jgi:DNA-directed RNA polymerase subunit M/transcription elongation factor TFIIS
MSSLRFCPTCRYYLYLDTTSFTISFNQNAETPRLRRVCRNCGHTEIEENGGLITELNLQEKVSEGYKVLVNEFTHLDPTLPHVHNIQCKNAECASNTGAKEPDVIYVKYDSTNMKFLYICNVCGEQWRSRS